MIFSLCRVKLEDEDIIQTRARQKSRASLISSNACLTLVMFLPWALCSIKIDVTFREQGAFKFFMKLDVKTKCLVGGQRDDNCAP
jgi:hypothetical protein